MTVDAIYAKELRDAQEQGRITSVPYDPTMPVSMYFDLGWSDQTAVWFVQHIGSEIRLIDFHQDAQRPFPTICMSSRSVATLMPRCGCHTMPRRRV
jgi:phage terminase large subunit